MPPLRGAGGRELEFPGGPRLPWWPPIPDASRPLSSAPRLPALFPGAHRAQGRQVLGTPPSLRGPRPASGAPARPQAPALLSGSTDVSVSHDDHVSVEFSSTRFPVRLPPPGWAFEGAREPGCRVGLGERRAPRLALAPGDTHSAPRAARLCTRTPRCSCGRPFPRPLARGSGVELRGGGELAVQPPASRTGDGPPASSAAAASPTRVSRPGRSLVLSFLFPFLPSPPPTPPSFFLSITTRGL